MNPRIFSLENCAEITGTAVVIDVLRAFTTAAYAFEAGAVEIILTGMLDDAFALREQDPTLLLMGEVNGRPIPGFNFSNSPTEIREANLTGRKLVQRTSAGTQGVLRSSHARHILAASLVNISATVRHLRSLSPTEIGFVATGLGENHGEEDVACAEAAICLLNDIDPGWIGVEQQVRTSSAGQLFSGRDNTFTPSDLEAALEIDRFNFAMVVQRRAGLSVLTCQMLN